MSKSKKDRITTMIETFTYTDDLDGIAGRDITACEPVKLISNRRLYAKTKTVSPIELVVPLNKKNSVLPYDYCLSNIPLLSEKKNLQCYHFEFTPGQLGQMFKTPKKIVDRWYNTFETMDGVVLRSSFFAVAPKANVDDGIPQLYRFSITQNLKHPSNYNITMHAVVGGAEDGWLFLGRLDDASDYPHAFLDSGLGKDFIKSHNAVYADRNKMLYQHLLHKYGDKKTLQDVMPKMYCVPFPHIHLPDSKYEIGVNPEHECPKFLRKCVGNTFEENLAFMMKIYCIDDNLSLRKFDDNLYHIMKEEGNRTHVSSHPNPQNIIKFMEQNQQLMRSNKTQLFAKTEKHNMHNTGKCETFVYRDKNYQNQARRM